MFKVYYPRQTITGDSRDPDVVAWREIELGLDAGITLVTGLEIPDPADYDLLISGRPSIEQIEASPNLHTLLIPWAGLPKKTISLMANYPHIAVHNLHHNAVSTAETALTLLLAAAKYLIPIENKFRQHDWRPRYAPNPAVMLDGKTALILGYGSVGQHVGRVCMALGMHVLATRKHPESSNTTHAEVYPPEALLKLLPQANILFITLPLTEETCGLIGEDELGLLPKGAIVINVGRGLVIDQHALYQALKEGHLHSAGLDVWYNYPPGKDARANTPPADVPFHELDNIVMSPHRGGGSTEIEIRRMENIASFLNLVAAGKPLPNRVDLTRGY